MLLRLAITRDVGDIGPMLVQTTPLWVDSEAKNEDEIS